MSAVVENKDGMFNQLLNAGDDGILITSSLRNLSTDD